MVAVPIYDTFKVPIVIDVLQEVDPHVIVTDSNERAKQLMNIGLTKSLHSIIITSENIHPETEAYAKSRNVKLYPFTVVEVQQHVRCRCCLYNLSSCRDWAQ